MNIENSKQELEKIQSISNSESVMNDFMNKLNDHKLTRDKEPTMGQELVIDEKFIDEQLETYEKLLKLPIVQKVGESTVEGPRLVKKLVSEDNNTKS